MNKVNTFIVENINVLKSENKNYLQLIIHKYKNVNIYSVPFQAYKDIALNF